jgi:hypothetical protein
MWLCQEFVDTPVNGRPSLFRIDSVHQVETFLSHALLVYNTEAHLQELHKSRFSISRDLNFMLSLSVRFNLTQTE